MATIEKRGQFWRVKIRRAGVLAQTRTFDNRTQAQQWARGVESEVDKGIVVDRRTAQRLTHCAVRALERGQWRFIFGTTLLSLRALSEIQWASSRSADEKLKRNDCCC
jgi:hypothetical protein